MSPPLVARCGPNWELHVSTFFENPLPSDVRLVSWLNVLPIWRGSYRNAKKVHDFLVKDVLVEVDRLRSRRAVRRCVSGMQIEFWLIVRRPLPPCVLLGACWLAGTQDESEPAFDPQNWAFGRALKKWSLYLWKFLGSLQLVYQSTAAIELGWVVCQTMLVEVAFCVKRQDARLAKVAELELPQPMRRVRASMLPCCLLLGATALLLLVSAGESPTFSQVVTQATPRVCRYRVGDRVKAKVPIRISNGGRGYYNEGAGFGVPEHLRDAKAETKEMAALLKVVEGGKEGSVVGIITAGEWKNKPEHWKGMPRAGVMVSWDDSVLPIEVAEEMDLVQMEGSVADERRTQRMMKWKRTR
ncbi:unnamed protein product [Polarella glacialis]|uniref:Uncharacterized protein n=1 Tax=Polarella glacialis TaxID=89957 RepID=A0A813L5Z2_POLGL|nr:unnamed protein product [Polarella glacialis]